MSVDTSAMHQPLFNPEADGTPWVPPLDLAFDIARETLDEHAGANIHDPAAMLRAAVCLEMRLRQLVAALDKEGGDR
ncbi:hypothetical protein [Streptomyces fulvorobeus]|uniref:Uncharacterized protein n=1 Tax=Streptomyces fulvorobeus TaxID=284028 RepID=A0A7J0C503_9ACTN|nr:hypothetical protein [Streptomyces fulvorobeus]NYE40712.1 hypothetical protein [Streptomyces fulvorobeus]GFM97014.1 hypothetical protein Sfulv_18250 [Streptomyces fulvorobeus]